MTEDATDATEATEPEKSTEARDQEMCAERGITFSESTDMPETTKILSVRAYQSDRDLLDEIYRDQPGAFSDAVRRAIRRFADNHRRARGETPLGEYPLGHS